MTRWLMADIANACENGSGSEVLTTLRSRTRHFEYAKEGLLAMLEHPTHITQQRRL